MDGIGRVTVFIFSSPFFVVVFPRGGRGGRDGDSTAALGCVLVSPRGGEALLCRAKKAHTGPGLWIGPREGPPCARHTMARIDRLNYRDIGVIKAPLCRGPLYQGVEEARDSTPGVKILAPPSPVLDSFLLFSPGSSPPLSPPVCHGNALLISHYPAGDARIEARLRSRSFQEARGSIVSSP